MLLIGTPAYNGMVHVDYVSSLISLFGKVKFTVMNIGNESLITRARNKIISYFYHEKTFDRLLFLDGDILIDGNDVLKLLNYNVDIIGARVPLKGFDKNNNFIYNTGNLKEKFSENLFSTNRIGTGVLLFSRKAVEALINVSDQYTANYFNPEYNLNEIKYYDVFKVGVKNGEYLSEDFYVCEKLTDLGYTIYVDPYINVRHNGMLGIGMSK